MDWDDYIEPDPDPELDRYSIWIEKRGDYVSVYDVSRLKRWWRFVSFDANRIRWRIHWTLQQHIFRHLRRCIYCGKLGCGPYDFSNTCSEEHSRAVYALRVANHKKLHLRRDQYYTFCREWIWQEIKIDLPQGNEEEFCLFCQAEVKGLKLYELLSAPPA